MRKPAGQRGFMVIPRRWAVERACARLTAHRRPARDYERHPAHSEAMIRWAAITTITRRIAPGDPASRRPKRVPTPLIRSSQTRSQSDRPSGPRPNGPRYSRAS
ncbi:MAG: transposase [Pseudonocardia sp.]|nr:transposase [Pseudonocardia sp.]